jgi:cytochrome P450
MAAEGEATAFATAGLAERSAPKGHPLWGHLPALSADGPGFLAAARAHGDLVPLRLINVRVALVSAPALIESALVVQAERLTKPPVFRRNRLLFGRSLLVSDGEPWRRQRRLAQPAFAPHRLALAAPVVVDVAERLQATWRDGETRDLRLDMAQLTLTTLSRALFGIEADGEIAAMTAAWSEVAEALSTRFKTYDAIPEWLPTPANSQLRRGVRRIEAVIAELVARRRAMPGEPDDLLGRLIAERDGGAGWMTDALLRDEIMTYLAAGHETVALALAWSWLLLAGHPEIEAAFHRELAETLGGRAPTAEDRPRLRLTEAILREALRLYPPIWAFARFVDQPIELGGCPIPRGWRLVISPWATQRDPRFFDEPERFDPARWLDGRAQAAPRYAFLPFGGGPKACIGAGFALLEGTLLLATLGQRVRFTLAPGHVVTLQAAATLRPRTGVLAIVHRR